MTGLMCYVSEIFLRGRAVRALEDIPGGEGHVACSGLALLLLSFYLCMIRPAVAQDIRQDFGSGQRTRPGGGSMLGVPDGFMMAGWHKSQNRICDRLLNNFDGNTLSIGGVASLTRNQRFGMLSCDEGFVAVGVHHGNGELLQQPLPSGLPYMYYFCFGDEPGWGQFNGMHACRPGDGIVGAHNDHNVFTSVTARKPPHMEGEPLNPTVADIFLDSLGCDQVVSDVRSSLVLVIPATRCGFMLTATRFLETRTIIFDLIARDMH